MSTTIESAARSNHLAFTQAEFMKSCAHKIKPYGFQHFSYIRILDHQERILITSDPAYSELSITKKFHTYAFFGPRDLYTEGMFLIDFLDLGEIKTALSAHDINIGCIIIKKRKNYTDHYSFGTAKRTPGLNNFIINNLDLFEEVIEEFHARAETLIKQYQKNTLLYPASIDTTGLTDPNSRNINTQNIFTLREQEILRYIKKGLSSKHVSQNLNISHRTVEKHLENMLIKTNTHSRIQLLAKFKS
jgi:DNA-binding CsgD family transcriptional regulator